MNIGKIPFIVFPLRSGNLTTVPNLVIIIVSRLCSDVVDGTIKIYKPEAPNLNECIRSGVGRLTCTWATFGLKFFLKRLGRGVWKFLWTLYLWFNPFENQNVKYILYY